ncbi:hypothetical protein DFJ74DRAFT_700826 [Hyaloraphidium curvatum]|nr:hypothetical protein DFJ74DRAFT_700826 [Hyaloraphidium curvatum]
MSDGRPPTDADFSALEGTLTQLLHYLASLGHAVLDFSNQDVVNEDIAVESGQNPDIHTSSLVSSAVSLNQAAKAKLKLMDELKAKLEAELAEIWPADVAKYREIMSEAVEEAKTQAEGPQKMDVDTG